MERREKRHDGDSEGKVLNLRSVFGLEATVATPSAATDGAYVMPP
jgi:hypothetical protein